jgi:N-acetylmuramoyl-L-alanine amidase
MEDDYKKKYDGFDPNSDEANIIFTFYQNVFLNQSLSLATKIQDGYKQKAGRTDKGVKQAGFLVLWRTAMPSLLTEIGYLTNHKEERFLGSEKGQVSMASSIFRAFRQYKNEVEGTNIKYSDDFEKPVSDTADETSETKPANTRKEEPVLETAKAKPGLKNTAKNEKSVARKDSTPDDKFSSALTAPKKLGPERSPEPPTNVDPSPNPAILPANIPEKKPDPQYPPAETVKPAVSSPLPALHEKVYKVIFYASEKKLELSDHKFANVPEVGSFQEGAVTKYTSGHFPNPQDAARAQAEIRKLGFKDAFVVPFLDGKRVK